MKNKHTAMQQLINEIVEHLTYDDKLSDDSRMTLETIRLRCLGKLSVEKEQIIDAYDKGEFNQGCNEDAEEYYNETYESNGSDAKDVTLGYKTSLNAQMLDKVEIKQENNLEEAAEKLYPKEGEDYTYGDLGLIQQDAFKFGAKWQQERMYSEEDMINFAEFVARYPDKNRNYSGQMLHAKSKYDGAERTIDLLQVWFEQFKKK
jgi:hypothetical protein